MAGQDPPNIPNGRRTELDELPIPMILKSKLRAQYPVPDSPSPSLGSSVSSSQNLHYTNQGYENTEFIGGHDYEDVRHLAVPAYSSLNGQRRHANPVYESSSPLKDAKSKRIRQDTERSDETTSSMDSWTVNHYPKDSWINKLVLALILTVSVTALFLVILMVVGEIGPKCGCKTIKSGPRPPALGSVSIDPLIERIKALERNATMVARRNAEIEMQEMKIRQLVAKLLTLESKLDKASVMMEKNVSVLQSKLMTEMRGLRDDQVQFNNTMKTLKRSDNRKNIDIGRLTTKSEVLAVSINFLNRNNTMISSEVQKLSEAKSRLNSSLQAVVAKDYQLDATLSNVKMREKNLTLTVTALRLADKEFSSILDKMNSSFTQKISDITHRGGSPGQIGPRGPPGPPGAGNLTQCQFTVKDMTATPGITMDISVSLVEAKDKKILGATCSTIGGDETELTTASLPGLFAYKCTCRGRSNYYNNPSSSKCRISAWVCPRFS